LSFHAKWVRPVGGKSMGFQFKTKERWKHGTKSKFVRVGGGVAVLAPDGVTRGWKNSNPGKKEERL